MHLQDYICNLTASKRGACSIEKWDISIQVNDPVPCMHTYDLSLIIYVYVLYVFNTI